MEWAEGWANENENENENESEGGLESSSTEGESSLAPSHEMNDNDDGLKARLSAVADCLAFPETRSVRDALRGGEELYEEGVRLWESSQKERAGAAFLRSITLCQDALGDALDSMEEEELEDLIALSEKQLAVAREHGWATHDDDTGAGLPPAQPHVKHPSGVDPFAPNGGSYEDEYDQEDFEGFGDDSGLGFVDRHRPQSVGMDFPITVSNGTADSGSDRIQSVEMPWPPSLQVSSSVERSRSTEPKLQSDKMLKDGWQHMVRGGAAFDERDFGRSEYADGVACRPHSMYDLLRSSPSRSSTGGHKANARAHGVYSDLSVVRMALGGPPPATASLPKAALERPSERPAGGQASNRQRAGRVLPSPQTSPRGRSETEISVARSTAHLLERSVEDLCPELTTPRRKGWVPVRPKCSPGSHTPLQASTLRTTHGGSWSVLNYQTRHNLRHPRSTVNAFRIGTPSALSRTIPRRAVRPHVNMYAESRPWRSGLVDDGIDGLSKDSTTGNLSSQLQEDHRQILFTMSDITRGAAAAAKLKLRKRAQKLKELEASSSPPRGGKARRNVSPQKSGARDRRLKRARELKAKRDAQKKKLESAAAEFHAAKGDGEDPENEDTGEAMEVLNVARKSGSFSVRWNDKLERSVVQEKQQKAKFLVNEGLTEEEHVKKKVSPNMTYLTRLATNAKRSYDEDAVQVKPMPCVLGAVAVTDSGQQRGTTAAQKKQAAAAAYAGKIQEILDRARQQDVVECGERGENDVGSGNDAVATVVELTMPESSALLDQHPGASERGAGFGRIEEAARCMAMVNKSTLLPDWPSAEIKLEAGSTGWCGWRPKNGMIGEIMHRWDWDQGLLLLKIAAQPGRGVGGGEKLVDRYCVMPKTACASVRVLGMQTASTEDSLE